ncbi:MAG: glycosyltransferase family 4 protein [archaeon]|nr:glycosyltransferase family 4 protein [archaeon]
MKHISMIGTQFLGVPAQKGGAIELLSFDLAKLLAENNYDVSYFSVQSEINLKEKNIEIIRFPAKKTSGILFNFFVFFKMLGKKTGAIYLSGCSMLPVALALSRLKRIPLIFHEFNHNPWIEKNNFAYDFLAKQSIKHADKVIVPTEFIRKKIIEFDSSTKNKIIVLPNFLDLKQFPKKMPEKSKQIAFVGRIVKHKNPELLIDAFSAVAKDFPEWKLKIFGTIDDQILFKNISKKFNEKISFSSGIERKQLIQELSNSSVFVLPSTQEAFGLAFLEAMACWTPCIGARIDSVKEVIKENETGFLINALDEKDLSAKLTSMLSQKQLRETMGKNARKKAETLSIDFLSPKYLNFFKEVIK